MMLNEQVPVHDAVVGGRLDLGRGAALEVVAVTKRGSVLALSWGGFRMLLPIGIDFNLLEEVPGAANVLLLAESGFAPLNPAGWIAAVDPGLILLSVEAGNREGLPSPDVETLLERYNVLRTDRDGWVEIRTDGEEVWVARGQQ